MTKLSPNLRRVTIYVTPEQEERLIATAKQNNHSKSKQVQLILDKHTLDIVDIYIMEITKTVTDRYPITKTRAKNGDFTYGNIISYAELSVRLKPQMGGEASDNNLVEFLLDHSSNLPEHSSNYDPSGLGWTPEINTTCKDTRTYRCVPRDYSDQLVEVAKSSEKYKDLYKYFKD